MDFTKKEYTEEELLSLAQKRLKKKRDLYAHIATYVVVNTFLIFIYFITRDADDSGLPWFIWPLAGWGVGLLIDIITTIQDLNLNYNTAAVNKELEKIKRSLDK